QNGHVDVVKILLEHGADVNAKCKKGKTALMFASEKGYQEIVELLKDAGATK
ncbi:MAG: ankyrin repeat domain-containing protein, partial [Lentisphaerae bacterium]